jgi:hypothetical protein
LVSWLSGGTTGNGADDVPLENRYRISTGKPANTA